MSASIFLASLGLTLLLEVPFAYAWGLRDRRNLAVAVLVNVLTNPAVVLLNVLISARTGWPWPAVQLPLEALAAAVEAVCYRDCGKDIRHPVLLSLCANGFSYCAGLLLNAV